MKLGGTAPEVLGGDRRPCPMGIEPMDYDDDDEEEQKQFLLQIVEKHRLDFPDSDKSTVVGSFLKH